MDEKKTAMRVEPTPLLSWINDYLTKYVLLQNCVSERSAKRELHRGLSSLPSPSPSTPRATPAARTPTILNVDMMENYKYLELVIDITLDLSTNTDVI